MSERVGRYELIRELGRGAMGVVWLARDPELGRQVSLKQLSVTDPRALRRFAAEAQAVARLQHPSVVKLHEAQLETSPPYLVMSYVEGESLEARLLRGRLGAEEATAVAAQLAGALEHAHAQGVLHRDVKPGNVLLGVDGRAYLSDFGLTRSVEGASLEAMTRTGQIVGTPAFMAPEQARGDRAAIGPATDVYGLGATLYAMLGGRAPHDRSNMMALVAAVTHEKPAPLRSLAPELEPALARIVEHCLEKRPEDRFQTATALAEALQTGAAPARRRGPGRGRWAAGLLGSAALVVTAAAWTSTRSAEPATASLPAAPVTHRPAPRLEPTKRAGVDPSWKLALLRLDDDPVKSWSLVAKAKGAPPPDVAAQMVERVRLHLVGIGFRPVELAKMRAVFGACVRIRRRVSKEPLSREWSAVLTGLLNASTGFREKLPADMPEIVALCEPDLTSHAADRVVGFVRLRRLARHSSWIGICRRLADRFPSAQAELILLLSRQHAPRWGGRASPVARARATEILRRLARLPGSDDKPTMALAKVEALLAQADWKGAIQAAERGRSTFRTVEFEGLVAVAYHRAGRLREAIEAALQYTRNGQRSSVRGSLHLYLLGVLWDQGKLDAKRVTVTLRADARIHGWRLRRVALERREGRAVVAAQQLTFLKESLAERDKSDLWCSCRDFHAAIQAITSPADPSLARVLKDMDLRRRRSGGGQP